MPLGQDRFDGGAGFGVFCDFGQGRVQHRGFGAFLGAQIGVAAGKRQPIGIAQRRHGDNLNRKIQIARRAFD